MTMDFGEALREITADAAGATRPVDLERAQSRMRRRRTQGIVLSSVGGAVGGIAVLVVTVTLISSRIPEDVAPVVPVVTSTPTPTASPALAGDLCGVTFALEETDDPDIEIQGAVLAGTLDRETAAFDWDIAPRDTLYVNVGAAPDVPDGPLEEWDRAGVTTVLVRPDGTVAFWSDPDQQLRVEATDGSGGVAVDGLYEAVDCRTGEPLTGTYRAYATTATDGTAGGETVALAPVSFELGSGQLASQWEDMVPTCGRPAPEELLSGDVDADFDVTLDPKVLEDVRKGLHADVTVTATGPGRLTGWVPQALHAVLVDRDGVVVSRVYDPTRTEFDSGVPFDVGPGDSFSAEVYQWFSSCPDADRYGNVRGGEYDLYLYSVILASTGPDTSPAPRVAVGGPFPVTLR